jgi:hypothetical protein
MKITSKCITKLTALISMVVLPTHAFANYFCYGPMDYVAVTPAGLVVVGSGAAGLNSVNLCQIGGTYNGVGPEQCKVIYSALLSANATGQQVVWAFNDNLTCTTHPSDQALTGWYYGPHIIK